MHLTIDNNRPYNFGFKSTRERVTDSLGRVINCHYTNMNGVDVNWIKLAAMLGKRFKGLPQVRINIFGSSDASDAYTLAIALRYMFGRGALKFFPFEASDISQDLINKSNRGEILLHDKDLEFLETMNSSHLFSRDYTKPIQKMRGIDFYPHRVEDVLRNAVNFSVKDVRKEAKTHDFSNQVFIFRNGWTFMDLESQNQITKDLAINSNHKTLFMIGQSDLFKSNACEFFQRNGFRGIKSDVFTCAGRDYPSISIGMPKEKSKYPEFILFEKM